MLSGEVYLLSAVTEILQQTLKLSPDVCNVEYEEAFAPSIASDLYISISPSGSSLGPSHNTSGGVRDVIYGCTVNVKRRSRSTPRDKRRSLYLDQVGGLNAVLDQVIKAIDWQQAVINRANALLHVVEADAKGFVNMLRVTGFDQRPRPIAGEVYAASVDGAKGADTWAGLSRGVSFGGARRIENL